MFRKITSLVVAVGALLLMQFPDCQAMSANQQTMKCCHAMPCDPANRAHDCYKKMVSPQVPSVLPSLHVPFTPPLAVVARLLPTAQVGETTGTLGPRIEAPQHSPPDLYILYANLLI